MLWMSGAVVMMSLEADHDAVYIGGRPPPSHHQAVAVLGIASELKLPTTARAAPPWPAGG